MNIHEAKTHLSRLIERVSGGEEIVISKAGKPVAKLVPYAAPVVARVGGFLAGQIWEAEDCWDPDSELNREMIEAPLFPGETGDLPHVSPDFSKEKRPRTRK